MHFDLRLVYFCVFLIVFSEMWCIWLLLMASGQLGAMINIIRVSEMGFCLWEVVYISFFS